MPPMKQKRKLSQEEVGGPSEPEKSDTGAKKVIPAKVSVAASMMRTESHPWLKWPGCNQARKTELNNRLAEMQGRGMCAPRFLEDEVVTRLNIRNQLSKLFLTRLENRGGVFEVKIWMKALNVVEDVYREWSLEFYSSLRVDKKFLPHEFPSKKLIHFRLGGKDHSVSVAEFGFLTGMLTEEESKDVRIESYLAKGKLSAKEFGAEKDGAWLQLTGLKNHSSLSKVSSIRSPMLRLVHKLLVYSFIHRLTQHDKCYLEDLWLLYTFHQKDAGEFVCVPWVLVCFMEAKGAGKVRDSQICCGHFITRMVKNLGLFKDPNIRACSPPTEYKRVTLHDLEVMKLVNATKTGLAEDSDESGDSETELRRSAAPAKRAKKGKLTVVQELQRLNRVMRRTEKQVKCLSAQYKYDMDRYRPDLEALAAARAAAAETSLEPLAPPPQFEPGDSDKTSEDEESDDSETEEEEAED